MTAVLFSAGRRSSELTPGLAHAWAPARAQARAPPRARALPQGHGATPRSAGPHSSAGRPAASSCVGPTTQSGRTTVSDVGQWEGRAAPAAGSVTPPRDPPPLERHTPPARRRPRTRPPPLGRRTRSSALQCTGAAALRAPCSTHPHAPCMSTRAAICSCLTARAMQWETDRGRSPT